MEQEKNNTKKLTGLVLGGGGARGCFEIGAWQAFAQMGIHFDCVAGTSIGALVGAIYTQQTLKPLEDFVYDMSPAMIAQNMPAMPEDWEQFRQNAPAIRAFFHSYLKNGGADISPLKAAIHKMFDWQLFSQSPINFACMTYDLSKMQAAVFFKKDMTEENAEDIILASASCYPAFPMLKMGDDYYIDGGYEDNLPVSLAQQMGAGQIVAIDVHGPGRTRPLPLDGSVRYIEPILPLDNFLDFEQKACVRSLHIGYLETLKQYDQCCGYLFTFKTDAWGKIFMMDRFLDLQLPKYGIDPTKELGRRIAGELLGQQPAVLNNKYTADYGTGMLVEDLALLAGMDPVKLYEYDTFMEQLSRHLKNLPAPSMPRSVHESLQLLKSGGHEEVLNFLHAELVHNQGSLPVVMDPLKHIFETEYILACIWYCLATYLPD